MKTTVSILALLFATNALAIELHVPPRRELEAVASPRKAKVLRDARAAFTLPDGSQWITHSVPAKREPSAIGVTRFDRDGSATVFLVSDWLPKGTIPGGFCGQVYGVAQLTDGRVAVSAGWTTGAASHNGIFVLRRRDDGRYDTDSRFELPGVGQIAGGPANMIVAVTVDATRGDGGPLLSVFDTDGTVRARAFAQDPSSSAEALRNAHDTHVLRVSDDLYAIYTPFDEQVFLYEMRHVEPELIFHGIRGTFVGDDAGLATARVLGIDVTPNGDILVVRSGMIQGRPGTNLTVYTKKFRDIKQSETLDIPWSLLLREHGQLRGLVHRDGVQLDTVHVRYDR